VVVCPAKFHYLPACLGAGDDDRLSYEKQTKGCFDPQNTPLYGPGAIRTGRQLICAWL